VSPDIRKHRGAHPEDRKLFAEDRWPALRAAVAELSWLLTRDYAIRSALKFVGDKFALTERQRLAVARASCSDQSKSRRNVSSAPVSSIAANEIVIDGFNLIILVEAALSGGVLIIGRDGCVRDLSSVHSSYRSVNETEKAIVLIGEALSALHAGPVQWLLDKPVSNSGRLAQRIRDIALRYRWDWTVELDFNPDAQMVASGRLVISSDGPLLDRVQRWTNFGRYLIQASLPPAWSVDLGD
jgi:hypothetical protein